MTTPDRTEEVQRLQSCINDLVSLLALPAMWTGCGPADILGILLEALLGILRLDFVYARLRHATGERDLEAVRVARHQQQTPQPEAIGRALERWLQPGTALASCRVPNPMGEGDVVIAPYALGLEDGSGVVVAGSRHADFPTAVDALLLRVGVNQAAIALREARLRTERDRTDEALRESEARFRQMADHAPMMVWVTEPDTTCTYLSKSWYEFTGQTEGARCSDSRFDAIHPDDRAAAHRHYVAAHARHEPFYLEYRLCHADGVYRWVIDAGRPRMAESGEFLGYIGSVIDITERKRAEATLQQAHTELEWRVQERTAALQQEMLERQRLEREAQRSQHFVLLGRLAAGVSHEIRNPLAAIFLNMDLLEEELCEPSPDSRSQIPQSITEIKTHLARLDDLVQDYLSLVRVAAIERTPHDLGAAIQSWADEWRGLATNHQVTLQLEGLADMGVVACHMNTLRRAVLNLVQNALDAMPQGGTLTLASQGLRSQVRLQVRDTGHGIPAEHLAQLFEPLYTTKPGGTGLGLYLVQEIMTAHGGQVTVESVEGQGTTFTLILPRT